MTDSPDLSGALEAVETYLLGQEPCLTRLQVAEQAGVPPEVAQELWRLMGFPQLSDDDVAFTEADVTALKNAHELMELGILGEQRQAALVRTWGRSYARLAEWQVGLLTDVALESQDAQQDGGVDAILTELAEQVLPRVESLQSYVWRRHLVSAGSRMLAVASSGAPATEQAVCFVDIVGYTSRSKALSESELVDWLEHFESETLGLVVDHGGRIIKNIGDEVLFVTDAPTAAAAVAVLMTRRGNDGDDRFPEVRAGIAYGEVVSRLGDVFGPVVNIAARLTSAARPGTVVIDRGAYEALSGRTDDGRDSEAEQAGDSPYAFKRIRRLSVKGYSRLHAWTLRPRDASRRG